MDTDIALIARFIAADFPWRLLSKFVRALVDFVPELESRFPFVFPDFLVCVALAVCHGFGLLNINLRRSTSSLQSPIASSPHRRLPSDIRRRRWSPRFHMQWPVQASSWS
jgi:hypothetical protein